MLHLARFLALALGVFLVLGCVEEEAPVPGVASPEPRQATDPTPLAKPHQAVGPNPSETVTTFLEASSRGKSGWKEAALCLTPKAAVNFKALMEGRDEKTPTEATDTRIEILAEKIDGPEAEVEARIWGSPTGKEDVITLLFLLRLEEGHWGIRQFGVDGHPFIDMEEPGFGEKKIALEEDDTPLGAGYFIHQPHHLYPNDKVLIWHSPARKKRKFLLKPGTPVEVLEIVDGAKYGESHDMYRIRTIDGREGWVPAGWCNRKAPEEMTIDVKTASVKELLRALSDGPPPVRIKAALELGERDDKTVIEPLIVALSDEDPKVRYGAAWSLGRLTDQIFGEDADKWWAWWKAEKSKPVDIETLWKPIEAKGDKGLKALARGRAGLEKARSKEEKRAARADLEKGIGHLDVARYRAQDFLHALAKEHPGAPMSLYENRMAQWTQAYENALPDLSPSRAKAYRLRDLLKNVWAGSVERYVEAVLKNPDPSNAPDMTVLMDEAAKEKGYKDWADLCVKVAMSDPELYEKVVVNVAKFMTQRMVWMSEEMAKRKKGK